MDSVLKSVTPGFEIHFEFYYRVFSIELFNLFKVEFLYL